jgi:hypothetical protein
MYSKVVIKQAYRWSLWLNLHFHNAIRELKFTLPLTQKKIAPTHKIPRPATDRIVIFNGARRTIAEVALSQFSSMGLSFPTGLEGHDSIQIIVSFNEKCGYFLDLDIHSSSWLEIYWKMKAKYGERTIKKKNEKQSMENRRSKKNEECFLNQVTGCINGKYFWIGDSRFSGQTITSSIIINGICRRTASAYTSTDRSSCRTTITIVTIGITRATYPYLTVDNVNVKNYHHQNDSNSHQFCFTFDHVCNDLNVCTYVGQVRNVVYNFHGIVFVFISDKKRKYIVIVWFLSIYCALMHSSSIPLTLDMLLK